MKELKDLFIKHGKQVNYKKNDIVFNEHELCESVGYITKGKIKISTITNEENEYVINLLKNDEIFGDLLVFSSNPRYYGIAICQEYTQVIYISKNKLLSLFKEDSSLLSHFLKIITDKGVYLKQLNKMYAHKNIEERIMYYLKHVAKKTNNQAVYYKSLTDIAHILSVPRPSLSRSIHNLERLGYIKINKHLIELKK